MQTAARQTMQSWARRIASDQEVPQGFQDFFKTLPVRQGEFPYTLLTPSPGRWGLLSRSRPRLVCLLDSKLYALSRAGQQVVCTCYALPDISYIEFGSILLKAWLKIQGMSEAGVLASDRFEFNAVTTHLFSPILKQARGEVNAAAGQDRERELAKFSYLMDLNFKFMNYARSSLLPGEQVVSTILQPEIRRQVLRLPGKTLFRTLATAHLFILTDRELITICDEDSWTGRQGIRYGGIWTFIPLNKIRHVSLAEADEDTLCLSLHLPHDDRLDALFASSNRQAVECFKDIMQKVTSNSYGRERRNGDSGAPAGQAASESLFRGCLPPF
jgi:hypothetical protein